MFNRDTKIVVIFPGFKCSLQLRSDYNYKMIDFPFVTSLSEEVIQTNYENLKNIYGKYDIVFIQLSYDVLDFLKRFNINHIILIPDYNNLEDYLIHIEENVSRNKTFLDYMKCSWNKYFNAIEKSGSEVFVADKGQDSEAYLDYLKENKLIKKKRFKLEYNSFLKT